MDTRHHSIAEVMGWRYHPGSRAWKAPGRHEFIIEDRHTVGPSRPPQMDADDMMEWLIERSSAVVVRCYEHHVEVYAHDPDEFTATGSTLLAALEATVRTLAEP